MNRTTGEAAGGPSQSAEDRQTDPRTHGEAVPDQYLSDSLRDDSRDWWRQLHYRICDRIPLPVGRAHLLRHADLEPGSIEAGWPTLRLVVRKEPPVDSYLLFNRYREALTAGTKGGVLADLAASLVVVEAGK